MSWPAPQAPLLSPTRRPGPTPGALASSASPRLVTVPDYRDAVHRLPRVRWEAPALGTSPLRRMTDVERATVRVTPVSRGAVPLGNSIPHEAAFRLAVARRLGWLGAASGRRVAANLETAFWGSHPSRRAERGWDLLAVLDELEWATVTVSAEPRGLSRSFRPMRLAQLRDELAQTTARAR